VHRVPADPRQERLPPACALLGLPQTGFVPAFPHCFKSFHLA